MSLVGQESESVNPTPGNIPGKELILVVEDDAGLRRLIEKRLAAAGYRTVGASDGASALESLRTLSPRLMLLDYSLPDMQGEQLLERIEMLGHRVPFIVATGHGSESVAVKMMKRGAYDYLVKGATFMKLLPAVVDQALERVRQAERLVETEEELRRAHDELELRVEQRTAELAEANRRLRVEMNERRRAEELLQQHQAELAHVARLCTVGEMVAELAHELNQPLSAISSYAQACKRLLHNGGPDQDEDLSASLNQVSEQTDRAAEIIRRVRRFVAKTKPVEAAMNMNAVIRDMAELMGMDARTSGAEVVLTLDEPLPSVVGDRIQLEQVLVNLMRNGFEALKESTEQPRRLTIRTTSDRRQGRVVVDVEDNGEGITPDTADQVFDRFYTTKPNGMGMGLPISRSIVENHSGELWCEPLPGRGAVFHFTLPIDAGERSHV